jgi:sortase A
MIEDLQRLSERRREVTQVRLKSLMLIFVALMTMVGLAACGSSGRPAGGQGSQDKAQQETPDKQVVPEQVAQEPDRGVAAVEPPPHDMMRLTIPQMRRIENDEVPTGPATDETLFHDYAAVHLKRTGYPWEKEANVYIAGHRLGYENTDSYLAFWDLNKLEEGDEFYITDSQGRKYTYEVFRKFTAGPENLSVLAPVDGRNIVTLQTCTLPDYTNRLLVRGEIKDIEGA